MALTDFPLVSWTDQQFADYGTKPQACSHRLNELDMFSKATLIKLLDSFPRDELQAFTMGTDPCDPGDWSSVDTGNASGEELWQAVEKGALWLNLLWIDVHRAEYGELLQQLYGELSARVPRLQGFERAHLTLLISSPRAQVYYHFDAEDNMLWHLQGEKTIYVYPVSHRDLAPPNVVEDIFARTASEELPFKHEYDPQAEAYDLQPGQVVSWPHSSPHRVQNGNSVNVSISTSVETHLSERMRLTHCANRMLRQQFGFRNLATSELGLTAASKRFAYKLVRKLGMLPRDVMPEYITPWRIDPAAEKGMRRLEQKVHTPFCSTAKEKPELASQPARAA